MNCPRCSKDTLKPKTYENVQIDECSRCNGVWLDPGEIKQIIDSKEMKFEAALIGKALKLASAGVPEAEKTSDEKCPKCSAELNPLNYNYSSGIVIDVCPDGHGLWLDSGELEGIQASREHWDKKVPELAKEWASTLKKVEEDSAKAQKTFDDRMYKKLGPIGDLAYYIAKKIGI